MDASFSVLLTVPRAEDRVALIAACGALGASVETGLLQVQLTANVDAIGLWTGGTSGTSILRHAGSLSHGQFRFPFTEMYRSHLFTVPFLLSASDDQFADILPYFRTRLTSGRTLLEALDDLCDSPFRLPKDWCPLDAAGCGSKDGEYVNPARP
eukprot:2333288-Prymnesium_polylepis.1